MTPAEHRALVLLLQIAHMTLTTIQRFPLASVDVKTKAGEQLARIDRALSDLADEERKRA